MAARHIPGGVIAEHCGDRLCSSSLECKLHGLPWRNAHIYNQFISFDNLLLQAHEPLSDAIMWVTVHRNVIGSDARMCNDLLGGLADDRLIVLHDPLLAPLLH